ncbi:type II toxin-antitoxin system Phd/YefM family antitoxin [Microlunatus parietis]|uniref:Antitoxin n=1 Tax=Microlunatus parietis TaxID=682979 RepID=A0A7Y9I482_9ACTN|nr:type II toxin-antitoxin system Phd/YefM family antitoxin [Microlunatus parietis]NYE69589.1 prevent-host-death family protein [Microlunatus parietis]
MDREWSVTAAKARLSELLDRVISDGPHMITRRGRAIAVVVAVDEWRRKSKRSGSLAEFYAASPLRVTGFEIERPGESHRDLAL